MKKNTFRYIIFELFILSFLWACKTGNPDTWELLSPDQSIGFKVFIVNENKVVRFRPVKTGITGESEIEVLENLKEGQEIVSGSFQTLRTIKDGAPVKIDNSAKSQSENKS